MSYEMPACGVLAVGGQRARGEREGWRRGVVHASPPPHKASSREPRRRAWPRVADVELAASLHITRALRSRLAQPSFEESVAGGSGGGAEAGRGGGRSAAGCWSPGHAFARTGGLAATRFGSVAWLAATAAAADGGGGSRGVGADLDAVTAGGGRGWWRVARSEKNSLRLCVPLRGFGQRGWGARRETAADGGASGSARVRIRRPCSFRASG